MERLIVDRIENGIAVLEKDDLTHIEIPVSDLDSEIKEGNVLLFENGRFSVDFDSETERRQKNFEKQKNIFKNR